MGAPKISAIIIDDEADARKNLESVISELNRNIEILATARNADMGFELIKQHLPDLVFLDIEMPGKSGLDLVNDLKENEINTTVIFTTAFDQYAIDAIKYATFDYLLKPVDPEELKDSIDRYLEGKSDSKFTDKIEKLNKRLNTPRIKFSTRNKILFINPIDIVYCKADGNYSSILLADGRSEFLTIQIGNLLEELSNNLNDSFIRVSRSLIINLEYLTEVNKKMRTVKLKYGDIALELPVSSKGISCLLAV